MYQAVGDFAKARTSHIRLHIRGLRESDGEISQQIWPDKEKSYESNKVQNGYFTYSLVRALKQDGGAASVAKVFNIVRDEVSKQVLADWKVHQTPVVSKSSQSADIVIGVRPETFAARAAN